MTAIHRITTTIAATGAVAGLALVPATGALASSHSSFIKRFHRIPAHQRGHVDDAVNTLRLLH